MSANPWVTSRNGDTELVKTEESTLVDAVGLTVEIEGWVWVVAEFDETTGWTGWGAAVALVVDTIFNADKMGLGAVVGVVVSNVPVEGGEVFKVVRVEGAISSVFVRAITNPRTKRIILRKYGLMVFITEISSF